MPKKKMSSSEYLEHLATEERRSALLAYFTTDIEKKRQEERRTKRIRKLIQRVKAAASGGIETCEAIVNPENAARRIKQ